MFDAIWVGEHCAIHRSFEYLIRLSKRDENHTAIRKPAGSPIHSEFDVGLLNPAEVGLHFLIGRGFRDRIG